MKTRQYHHHQPLQIRYNPVFLILHEILCAYEINPADYSLGKVEPGFLNFYYDAAQSVWIVSFIERVTPDCQYMFQDMDDAVRYFLQTFLWDDQQVSIALDYFNEEFQPYRTGSIPIL